MTPNQLAKEAAEKKVEAHFQATRRDWPSYGDALVAMYLAGVEWDRSPQGDGLSPHVKHAAYHGYQRAKEKYSATPQSSAGEELSAERNPDSKAWAPFSEVLSLRAEAAALRDELSDADDRAAEWERIAHQWMEDYDKLKAKYEPMIAVTSDADSKGGERG